MNQQKARILLVEDSLGDAAVVEQALAQSLEPIFELQMAASMDTALDSMRDRFDAIVLDLELPDSAGLRTIQQVLDAAPDTPVVVLSGTVDPVTARRCVHWGASAFLSKENLRAEGLCSALRGAIERGRPKPD